MGEAAVPLILNDLQARGGEWYAALRSITGASPAPADGQGDIRRMTEAWVAWAQVRGYLD